LSKADLKLLSLDLGSDEGIFVNIRDAFLVVIVIHDAHHSNLPFVWLDHSELVSLIVKEGIGPLAELDHGQDNDDDLKDDGLYRQHKKLVTPVHAGDDQHICDENESVAEDEAEVGRQS